MLLILEKNPKEFLRCMINRIDLPNFYEWVRFVQKDIDIFISKYRFQYSVGPIARPLPFLEFIFSAFHGSAGL